MKIMCIDDDVHFINKMKKTILEYSFLKNIDIEIVDFISIPDYVPCDVDAFFLDIEIKDTQIFHYMSLIREQYPITPIIILSNFENYIHNSVKFYIFDFIRKREFDKEFEMTMNRLLNTLSYQLPYITIKKENSIMKIKFIDIIYVESYSHSCVIHLKDTFFEINKGIKDIFQNHITMLLRIHRSYYINKDCIENVGMDNITLIGNIVLPMGKKYKNNIKEQYLKYLSKTFDN